MHEPLRSETAAIRGGPQFHDALEQIARVLVDGLKHGYFDYSLRCEVVKGGKRQLVIKAGKSHLFVIPVEDLPR
jgi:hypothetical protein